MTAPDQPQAPFEAWLRYCFARPSRDVCWDDFDEPPDASGVMNPLTGFAYPSDLALCEYATRLFLNAPELLRPFTAEQIEWGFWEVFSGVEGPKLGVRNPKVRQEKGFALLDALLVLYRDYFAPVCGRALSHLNEGAGTCATACYMLWDSGPLRWSQGAYDSNGRTLDEVDRKQLDVFAAALSIDSNAVCESALHGLGHAFYACPDQVAAIVDAFLANPPMKTRPALLEYARLAQRGEVM